MISPRTLLLFYTRHLRLQPLRELMAIFGVAAGVALLFTMQIANSSVVGSFEQISRGVAGRATLEVAARSPEGFDGSVYAQVAQLPGIRATAPILEQRIVAVGPAGSRELTLIGADERLPALGGTLAAHFQRAVETSRRGLVAMTEPSASAIGARPGGVLSIKAGDRIEHLSVAAIVPSSQIGALAESPVAAAALPVVQSLSGLAGRISRILIEPQPKRSAELQRTLEQRFGAGVNIRPVSSEARLLADAARPEGQLTALFSLIGLVVGMILAYNAVLLASGERRAFIAYLIQLGTPDAAVAASLAFDALLLGIAGCALGLLLGDLISLFAYRAVPGYLTASFAIGNQRVLGLHTVLIAVGGGMLAAFAAAALPSLGLLRSPASISTGGNRLLSLTGRLRLRNTLVFAAGVSLVLLAGGVALFAPATTVGASIALVLGLVLCIPMIVRHALSGARALANRSSDPAARLALAELRSSPAHSVALVATGAIAVFLMVTIGGSVSDVQRAVRTGAAGVVSSAEVWISPGGAGNVYATEPFAFADAQAKVQQLPIVHSVLPYRQSFLDLPSRRVWVIGIPSADPSPLLASQLVSGDIDTADRHLHESGWATLSQQIASSEHLRVGAEFRLPTPTGDARLKLAATTSNYGWLPGTVLLSGADYSRLWHSALASQLGVVFNPGVSPSQGKLAVERALGPASALSVESDGEREAEASAVLGGTLTRLSQISTMVLIAAIVTVLAMMVSAVWQRQGRLDALMSIGMSFGQLARMVFYECGLVLLTGCMIGMLTGIFGQALVDRWLNHTTGSPVRFNPAWELGLRTILIATLISTAVTVMAVLRTVGPQPRTAFSTE